MSFIVSNLSQNALLLSDGKMLASGDKRTFDTVTKTEKNFEKRGWLQVIEEQPKEDAPTVAAQPVAEATPKTEVKATTEGVKK